MVFTDLSAQAVRSTLTRSENQGFVSRYHYTTEVMLWYPRGHVQGMQHIDWFSFPDLVEAAFTSHEVDRKRYSMRHGGTEGLS